MVIWRDWGEAIVARKTRHSVDIGDPSEKREGDDAMVAVEGHGNGSMSFSCPVYIMFFPFIVRRRNTVSQGASQDGRAPMEDGDKREVDTTVALITALDPKARKSKPESACA